jgi:hypothetical protein
LEVRQRGTGAPTTRNHPFSYVIVVTHTGSVSTLVHKDAFWHDFEIMSNCHGIWHAYNVGSLIMT